MSTQATPAVCPPRVWKLEIDSHGTPYTWTGYAYSESGAAAQAKEDLAHDWALFDPKSARVTTCVEQPQGAL